MSTQTNALIFQACILTTNSTRITPSSTVPFPRDSGFIKRDNIMLKLDSLLKPSATYKGAALFGLGGIGSAFSTCCRLTDSQLLD